jgi:hypothetical protein
VVLLVPLAALLLGLVSTTVSQAASYFPLADSRTLVGAYPQYATVDTAYFSMAPGEIRRVTDQLDIRLSTGKSPEVDNRVICLDQNSNIIGPPGTAPLPYSDENVGLSGVATGSNYTQDGHAYQWNVSMLIQAPRQDPRRGRQQENYSCRLLTRLDRGYRMTVLAPTTGETKFGTWLEVSPQNELDAQEVDAPYCQSNDTVGQIIGGGTYKDGYSVCSYLGPAYLRDPSARNVSWQPNPFWTAASNASFIDGIATFQITSCPRGIKSCRKSQWGYSDHAAGTSYLDIDQLYPSGSVCKVNRAFSEKSSGGKVFLSESYNISNGQHHLPLYYQIYAPVQTCGGSRRFKVILHIHWTGGNPVKIDGAPGNVNLLNVLPSPLY